MPKTTTTPPKRRAGRQPKPGPDKQRLASVRDEFEEAGVTISGWARANGFARMTVVDVLLGRRTGHYGEAHRVAVALGLKKGRIADVKLFKPSGVSAAPSAPAPPNPTQPRD